MNQEKIIKTLQDHERRLMILENKKSVDKKGSWYRSGSTIDKLMKLVFEGFFKRSKNLNQIILKLEEKDFHLKSSDLTLPLRKIVRKGILSKTKQLSDGTLSKTWFYIKV